MPDPDAVAHAPAVGLDEAAKLARIWTVPNVISFLRLLCLPLFVYVLFGRENRAAAAWILVGIGATDWVDGYIARNFDQVTTLGKVLDPVADRLLFFVGITAILIDGSIPVWFAVAVLVREILVSVGTVGLAALGARRIDVTWIGKTGTFLLMGAIPLFLGAESTLGWAPAAEVLAYALGIPGLVCSYWAALRYIPMGRQALREGRAT
ncbi:MAG TPA: CDP-alcohol phosphatidyltransferase family protein [Acidimicrobiales bacterium]|nr:CDP-alcohol phosphatidyltransferase family protein [Acidimicrobiales bacterium]